MSFPPRASSLFFLLLPLLLWGLFAVRAQAETLTWDASSTTAPNPIVPRWNNQAFFPTSLSGNTLIINPGQALMGTAFGGVSQTGDVSSNHTIINPGANVDILFGGFSEAGTANDIHVVMEGGTVRGLYAGGTGTGKTTNGSITLKGGTVTEALSVGPGHEHGDSSGNWAYLEGGSVGVEVAGGASEQGTHRDNHIVITGTVVGNVVYGGEVKIKGDALKNTVSISGGSVGRNIYGGFTHEGTASENIVSMSGGKAGRLTGGRSTTTGIVSGNIVSVTGGEVTGHIVVGGMPGAIQGGFAASGTVENNQVLLSGGQIKDMVYGGAGNTALVKGNSVLVGSDDAAGTYAQVSSTVYGGHQQGASGSAEGNSVGLSGRGEVRGHAIGGYAARLAKDNVVTMHGGDVRGDIRGGEVSFPNGKAEGNRVDLYGGTVLGQIYGGYAEKGTATGNTVNLYSGNFVNSGIYGGWSDPLQGGGEATLGNTLNVFSKGLTVRNVGNFENYNFIMPADIAPGDTMLHIVDTNNRQTDMSYARVGAGKIGGGMLLRPGDRINLVTNVMDGIKTDGLVGHTIKSQHGVSVEYDFTIRTSNDSVYITVGRVPTPDPTPPTPGPDPVPPTPDPDPPVPDPPTSQPPVEPDSGVRINPATKAFAEAKVALLAFIGQGSTLALKGALAAQPRKEDPWGLNVFAIASGGTMRYDTGSHVDLSGSNMASGISRGVQLSGGRVLLGAFVEAGLARYATYNSFADRPSVGAKGNGRYYGAGFLAHYTQQDKNKNARARGFHAEGTVRAGGMEMDFATDDMRDIMGRKATYKTNAPYVGGHVGVGYIWELGSRTNLDAYTELHVTHLGANSFEVLGDPIRMDAATSLRWRAGLKLDHQWNEKVRGHVGAAFQQSFDGVVRGKAYHLKIPQTQLQGTTGIAEAGLNIRPDGESGAFSANVSAHGAVGQQRGFGGEVLLMYEF